MGIPIVILIKNEVETYYNIPSTCVMI